MKCPMREKKTIRFLFWKFAVQQEHEWEIEDIGVHMPGISNTFKVERRCKYCEKFERISHVEHEELIQMGYTPDEISDFGIKRI